MLLSWVRLLVWQKFEGTHLNSGVAFFGILFLLYLAFMNKMPDRWRRVAFGYVLAVGYFVVIALLEANGHKLNSALGFWVLLHALWFIPVIMWIVRGFKKRK
jgi:hypothetical protein